MPATLDDRLRALGDDLLAASAPITRDELGTVAVVYPVPPRRSRRWIAAAALATAAAVVAIVIVTTRPDEHHSIGAPSADGRMLLDPLPSGWQLIGIDESPMLDRSARAHLYERLTGGAAHVAVRVFDARWNEPYMPNPQQVDVAGHDASIYDDNDIAGHRAVSYKVDGNWVVVRSTGLTDDELVALAAGVTIDGSGAGSIAPETLSVGFTDLGAAWQREENFVTDAAGLNSGPGVSWRNGDRSFGFFSVPGEASAPLLTFFAADVVSVDVRGVDASLVSFSSGPDFLGLVWVESGRTYFASGYQLDRGELLDLVDRLGAATDDEWDRAISSLVPPVATIDPSTGVPAPGSAIPTKVTLFPALPADALASLGNPTPFAQYIYYSAGVDHPGSLWEGAIGPDDPTGSAADIVITVADPGDAEMAPAEPGRNPTITEHLFGGGGELYTTRDGFEIVLRGTDVNLMYDVIELVRPRVIDGALAGYEFSGALPAGLVETAAPIEHALESGSFPELSFSAALQVEVRPEPLANAIASDRATFTTYDTTLGTAFVWSRDGGTDPSLAGDWIRAYVELRDGSVLTLETAWLTIDEVLALIDTIDLVSQQEWESRYDPSPAIIPFIGSPDSGATATTAVEANG